MSQGHAQYAQDIVQSLDTNPQTGLTAQQAAERLTKQGLNIPKEKSKNRFSHILREKITDPLILLLITMGALYSIGGSVTDTLTIITIISTIVFVKVWNKHRAKRYIDELESLAAPTATVLRDGQSTTILASNIVSGDILLLKAGDKVAADAVLLDSTGLKVNKNYLNDKLTPIYREGNTVLASKTRINKPQNMVFAGDVITQGRAKAIVTAIETKTGLDKETATIKEKLKIPLQQDIKQLSKTLFWIALFFSILIPVISYIRGLEPSPTEAIVYGLSLAFAIIPGELLVITTIIFGAGVYALFRKKVIVKRLRAAETVGNTTVIVADKTGTITENKMHIENLYFDGRVVRRQEFGRNEKEALKTALLASDSVRNIAADIMHSNPMTQAIWNVIKENNVKVSQLQQMWIFRKELSFDRKRKLASYIYQLGNSYVMLSSGAPENILGKSSKILLQGQEVPLTEEMRNKILGTVDDMAKTGQRLLAFSYRRIKSTQQTDEEQSIEKDGVVVGVIGFADKLSMEVKEAIHLCQRAGVKVIMITGDHVETARAIAAQVGIRSAKILTGNDMRRMNNEELQRALRDTAVFARTTPEDKLRLVRMLKENGETVAVTGDNIDDASALKEAHIGIAMGTRGTDIARENADIILTDDNFATITNIIKESRKVFANLRKSVKYYLTCKAAIAASFLLSIGVGAPLPLAPIHIIILGLFMDLAASAVFITEPEEADSMKKSLESNKLFSPNLMVTLTLGALSLFVAVSISYIATWYQTQDVTLAQTMAFTTWVVGYVFLAFNFRSEKQPLTKIGMRSNKTMLLWALAVFVTLIVAMNLPAVYDALKITKLGLIEWATVLAVSFAATFWMELRKLRQK